VTAKNKTLRIVFNEELLENTTYTLNFNGAVQDITEKNDSIFQFVFSTGNYIDSMNLTGSVTDAFTNKGVKDVLIALYAQQDSIQQDSVPMLATPIYICQTDGSGNFALNYLKMGSYSVFAIADKNKNLRLDPSESFGFLDEEFVQLRDSISPIQFRLFQPNSDSTVVTDVNYEYPGKVTVILSNPTENFAIRSSSGIALLKEEVTVEDSLTFWLAEEPISQTFFIVDLDGKSDTVRPFYKNTPKGNEKQLINITTNLSQGKLLPNEKFTLFFSEPFKYLDTSKLHFYDKDSVQLPIPSFEQINLSTITFDTIQNAYHRMELDSGGFMSIYGNVNQSKITNYIERRPKSYFGTIILNVDSVFADPVIVELLNASQEVVARKDLAPKIIFNNVHPEKHQVRLIVDENNDGAWTSGNLEAKMQPEKVIYNKATIEVKSNWEREVDWVLKKMNDGKD
jgi:uncharacterized protein (DUF2141 family)